MKLNELVAYLNDYLQIDSVPDAHGAFNGLQVDGKENIDTIAVAVDACEATIRQAIERKADLLIVHHGLFWGQNAPVTGRHYRRLKLLMDSNLPVYSCHLPLDAHPEVGNNHVLARMLKLEIIENWGSGSNPPIGVRARADISRDELVLRIEQSLGVHPFVAAVGPEQLHEVGIVTGGAGSWAQAAADQGMDTLLTGEGAQHHYFDAEEAGINLIMAGHYATETVGVKALAQHLERQFGLPGSFIDHPTGL